MNEKQKNEIKVGLTVLAGVAIILTGFFLVKEWSLGVDQYPLLIRFATSAGLQRGDAVMVNGVKSGKVESVTVDANSVLVRILLDGSIRLSSDATATIQMLELMGGKKIEIRQGTSREKLDRDRILPGEVDPDIAGALGMVGQLRGDIVHLSTNTNKLIENLNDLLGDRQFRQAVKESFLNLNGTMGELRAMVAENRAGTRRITENLSRLTGELDTLVHDTRPRINGALDRTTGVLERTDSLFADIRQLLGEVRSSRGLLHQMLTDTTFSGRIDSVMSKADRLFDLLLDKGVKVRIRL